MSTAITTFGASDMVLPIPHCIDLIVNQERHVMTAFKNVLLLFDRCLSKAGHQKW
jgi:hypothetical protein